MLRSEIAPVSVHAPASIGAERAEHMLRALEQAHALSLQQDWPLPYPDGGYGGDPGFDLYAVPGATAPASAHADQPIHWAALDACSSHGLVDPGVATAAIEGCVLSAFVQAALLGQDPAERLAERRATAARVEALLLGEARCAGERRWAQQAPERGLFGTGEQSVLGTAWLLDAISRRHDGGDGRTLRELWQLARQRSDELERLRASPNLIEAIDRVLRNAGESLEHAAVELAISRATYAPRTVQAGTYAELPIHVPTHDPALRPFGSAYTRLDTTGVADGSRLQVWLRGETGARWSLTALQLDGGGRELARLTAPARRVPRAFLPLILEPGAAEVIVVVTALPWNDATLRQLDEPPEHHLRLVLDR